MSSRTARWMLREPLTTGTCQTTHLTRLSMAPTRKSRKVRMEGAVRCEPLLNWKNDFNGANQNTAVTDR